MNRHLQNRLDITKGSLLMQEAHRNFDKQWDLVKKQVEGYFFRLGCSPEDTLDLVQETAMGAFRNHSSLKGDFRSWAFGIARNVFKNYLSKRKNNAPLVEDDIIEDSRANPERRALAKSVMEQCIGELDKLDRDCLILHDYHQYKFEKIAEILGISVSNAHYHTDKARTYLRARHPELVAGHQKEVAYNEKIRHIQGLSILN